MSTPPPQSPPAGWYANPEGSGMRWWDGEKWTEHFQAPPKSQPPQSAWRKRWPLLVGLAVIVGALIFVLGQGGWGGSTHATAINPNLLSTYEAANLSAYEQAIRKPCQMRAEFRAKAKSFEDMLRLTDEIDRASRKGSEAVREMQSFYRSHPDGILPSGETVRQVLADSINVLSEPEWGSPAGCDRGDAEVLERELSATP